MSDTKPQYIDQKADDTNTESSFLDEPEIQVMPGVYMSQYGKNRKQNGTNPNETTTETTQIPVPTSDRAQLIEDMGMMEEDKASLEAELLALQSQLQSLQTRIITNQQLALEAGTSNKLTLGKRTGLTGVHLLEQIDMRIDQITKHHHHLIDSQKQLEELLVTEDQDIIDAFEENKAVLIDQLERIADLKIERRAVLKTLGPHYAELSDAVPLATLTAGVIGTTTQQSQQDAPPAAVSREEDDEKTPVEKDTTAGLWL